MAESSSSMRAVLALMNELHEARSLAELEIILTRRIGTVVQTDLVTLNRIDLTGDMGGSIGLFEPEFISPSLIEPAFDRYVHEHPLVQDMARTGDGAPRRMSDFISVEEFTKLDLYKHVFVPLRSLHQIGFLVRTVPGLIIGIGVNRTHDDFTDEELELVRLIYEQLPAAIHHAQLRELHERESQLTAIEDLTEREREVLLYLRAGRTNQQIASSLSVSRRTIEKHLERLYAKLSVGSRTEAVRVLWN